MANLFILCGSPGSGKTTLSKKIADEQNGIRLSFDEMGCLRHSELTAPIVQFLQAGRSVVVDALYARKVWRRAVLEATEHIACERILVYMDIPLEECIRRNAQRPQPLPDFIVEDIHKTFEPPTLDEGWDEIRKVKNL